jgi:hypothetical protein
MEISESKWNVGLDYLKINGPGGQECPEVLEDS